MTQTKQARYYLDRHFQHLFSHPFAVFKVNKLFCHSVKRTRLFRGPSISDSEAGDGKRLTEAVVTMPHLLAPFKHFAAG